MVGVATVVTVVCSSVASVASVTTASKVMGNKPEGSDPVPVQPLVL